ncbi:MAG TPA: APC family permease [Gemmatimonadales bacterium]|nr:APC family permease [Gemmatimonadales bacterium]
MPDHPHRPEPAPGGASPDLGPAQALPDAELEEQPSLASRVRRLLVGSPRDLEDRRLFHRLSLIPFLAWVGLGADGLSSSSYGPQEAFLALGPHTYLAVALAVATAATVIIIAWGYSHIIEQFPHGGGGYVVATKLLGEKAGLVSGNALLVDYVLTITTSIAAAGDAMFSFLPGEWQAAKLPAEVLIILGLTTLNIRGVRESVITLTPIFIVFLITHVWLIGYGIAAHATALPATVHAVGTGVHNGLSSLGIAGMLLLGMRAYSLGGGTYTGIEAVSNGLPIMREPKVATGKRTMVYMAASLSIVAAGLLVCYLLWGVTYVPGKTTNAVLVEKVAAGFPLAGTLVVLTLFSEGALLVVAAQAGFTDGPRVLGNMAVDSWVPHRFAGLSERLTTQNGVVLMGAASLAALLYTRGNIGTLVLMYSINVFITFSLSMFAMMRFWLRSRRHAAGEPWLRRALVFALGFVLCITILGIAIFERFTKGGWVTLAVTGTLVALCFVIRKHYRTTYAKLGQLYDELKTLPAEPSAAPRALDPRAPTAAVLVASYGGLGIHTALNVFRFFPGYYKNLVFLSVGVVDSGGFKGEGAIEELRHKTEQSLAEYVELARRIGVPATSRYALGTDAVDEGEKLCLEVAREFPRVTYFAGKVIFQREAWYQHLLHNETAAAIQKRLQWVGKPVVIIPARVH